MDGSPMTKTFLQWAFTSCISVLGKVAKSVEAADKKTEYLTQENARFRQDLEEKAELIFKLNAELRHLNLENTRLDNENKDVKKRLEENQKLMDSKNVIITTLKADVSTCQTNLKLQLEQVEDGKKKIEDLKTQAVLLESGNQDLQRQLEEELIMHQEIQNKQREGNGFLQTQLKEEMEKVSRMTTKLQEMAGKHEEETEATNSTIKEQDKTIKGYERQVDDLTKELQRSKELREKLEHHTMTENHGQDKTDLQNELAKERAKIEELGKIQKDLEDDKRFFKRIIEKCLLCNSTSSTTSLHATAIPTPSASRTISNVQEPRSESTWSPSLNEDHGIIVGDFTEDVMNFENSNPPNEPCSSPLSPNGERVVRENDGARMRSSVQPKNNTTQKRIYRKIGKTNKDLKTNSRTYDENGVQVFFECVHKDCGKCCSLEYLK